MDNKTVLENLCSYDSRNPNNVIDEDDPQPQESICYCDNCYYGRKELAMEIIRLKEIR